MRRGSKGDFFTQLEGRDRYTLFCCFFTFGCSGFMALMMGSIMPMLRAQYGVSEALGGTLLSAHSLGNLISGFTYGLLPIRFGYKRSIVAVNALTYIGFAMLALMGQPVWLLCAFLFTGLGRGALSNFNNSTVAKVTDSNPMALNVLHGFFAIGAFAAPYAALAFTARGDGGWKGAALLVALLGGAALACMSRMHLTQDRPAKENKKTRPWNF